MYCLSCDAFRGPQALNLFIIFHPSSNFILTQGQGSFVLCADSFFSRSLSTVFNFLNLWPLVQKETEVLGGDKRALAPQCLFHRVYRSLLQRPMSEVWDRKWGHPPRQFNKRVRQGTAPSQKVSVRAQCLIDNYPFLTFLSWPRRKWRTSQAIIPSQSHF